MAVLPSTRPAGSRSGNVLCRSTSSTTMGSRMVSAYIARPLTHEEIAFASTPCAAPAASTEDELSNSTAKRRNVHVDPTVRDWFIDMSHQWRTDRRWDMQRCLCEVRRLCPAMLTESTGALLTGGNRACHQQHRSAGRLCSHPQT